MATQNEMAVKLVTDNWFAQVKRTDDLFNTLTDEDLQKEVAPGRNTGIYLLGHLTAVHDRMLPLLSFDEQLYPQLNDAFIASPDKSNKEFPAIKDLRLYWKEVNEKLAVHFNNLSSDEWFQKHSAVSAEDFEKEPHRNRLNVLISRTSHLAYHLGQLIFLKE